MLTKTQEKVIEILRAELTGTGNADISGLSDCDTREMEAIYTISRSAKDALRQYRSEVS